MPERHPVGAPQGGPHAIDPAKLVASAVKVYGAATFAELYGTLDPIDAGRVRSLADGETVPFGSTTLAFHHTRGHANHHFVVHDTRRSAVFTGDAFGIVYPDLQAGGLFAIASTSPTDFDAPEALASLERVVATGAERVYLTHFGGSEDLAGIASQLTEMLEESGRIVDEADAEVADGELDAFCAARVNAMLDRALAERGLTTRAAEHAMFAMDRDLNAQGLAFAVRKRRFKASQGR